jgi:molybdate transport system ATP-binding protein
VKNCNPTAKEKTFVEIKNAVPRKTELAFNQPINWKIQAHEHWAVIGANGAGKTLLADIFMGKHALKTGEIIYQDGNSKAQNAGDFVKFVAFRDIYSFVDSQNSYYQQRWNVGLEDEAEVATIQDFFNKKSDLQWIKELISVFGIEDLLEKKIHLLSSGELRKFLIVNSLSQKPRILIMDNPFIGLDSATREVLKKVLERLAQMDNLQIILLVADTEDIPPVITQVLPVKDKTLLPPLSAADFKADKEFQKKLFHSEIQEVIPKRLGYESETVNFVNALIFNKINIKYGSRFILKNLSWQVKRGEKWALLGANGSGKSTLLSLVAGDNPQAYANDITLFDRKRGTGESIWDIKKHIGYVSPEMHLYYQKNVTCLDVVGSGFFDTVGLYRKCSEEQGEIASEWMKVFDIERLKNISFLNVSTGEQRLILLARVFVKNPALLILDEPLHGLDMGSKQRINKLIKKFCTPDKALIYVTHYKEEIPDIIDHTLILEKQ